MIQQTRTGLGPHFSEGARRLWRALLDRGTSRSAVASLLNISQSHLHRLMYGDVRLSDRALSIRVHDLLGIDPRLFDQPPRRRFVPPAARASTHTHSSSD